MSAFLIVGVKLALTRKKSRRECISGFVLLQVNLLVSGLKTRHTSIRSSKFSMFWTSFSELLCVVEFPPFLSLWTSNTKLKSPPTITSSHSKERMWQRRFWKKAGLSLFGAYMLTKVITLLLIFTSIIINLPS